ncbi:MAG: MATE family efflux transporter [Beduini sp.]|uniref:MATE family efflux transporter n=1 Tax=Beduini sp. TaxID=1922300 RepID=UPI00399F36AE
MINIIEPKVKVSKERQIFSNYDLKRLIIPLLVEQLLLLLVGMTDTLMVSYAGEAAVSGVSLVNQINSIFIAVFTALASGGAVVISQYIGKRDRENGIRSANQLLLLSIIISIVITILISIFHAPLLRLLFGRVETNVMEASQTYLLLTALSFPALAIYNSCSSILRSMSKTKITMYVSIIMNLINIVGNYVGIFVLNAGVAGVAVPSLISRMIAAIIMFVICTNKSHAVYLRLKNLLHFQKEIIHKIINIAVPNGIEGGMLDASKVALSSIIAMFGTTQIAANGVAQSFWSIAALFSIVMGPVFITVIGQCIGANDYEAAQYYVKKLLRITYLGCLVWDTVIFIITPFILNLYSLSSEAIHLVIILCFLHNVFNAILHPSGFVLANALRAAGDVKYTMYTSIFATVIVRVILSIIFGVWMNLGVIGVAIAMGWDWLVRVILIVSRYRSGKWKQFKVI